MADDLVLDVVHSPLAVVLLPNVVLLHRCRALRRVEAHVARHAHAALAATVDHIRTLERASVMEHILAPLREARPLQ